MPIGGNKNPAISRMTEIRKHTAVTIWQKQHCFSLGLSLFKLHIFQSVYCSTIAQITVVGLLTAKIASA
jgi:hypothetical protein